MNQNIWSLIGFAAVALIVVGGLAFLSQHYTLDNIKSKTVGDGQYGTARWATKREIQKTYRHVPFQPELWRKGEHLPRQQGLVLGSLGRKNHVTALVDCDDIHCLMIGASGVGKTAFFLYPNLEYACASGMSYLALDTKGDLARNYGAVASKYYGYQVSVIDLRNPTRSDGNNLLTLINRYMDLARGHPDNLTYKARAEKYTKILAKSIINPEGESSRGENASFYESAESLLAAVILLLSEYLPPTEGEPEMRHIVSVFKLVQDLLAVDPRSRDQRNGFQILMDRLPENHRAYMLAGAALTASDQAMASVMSTVLSRLNSFLDTELEQMKVIQPEQIGDYLQAAAERNVLPLFFLELTTGLRRGELLALLWSDLDPQNRSVSVTKSVSRLNGKLVVSQPKTQHSIRTLIVPQQAVDLLIQEHSLHPNNPYLFPSPTTGTMYSPETVARIHKRILRDAGLEDCRFHDLRHTFATVALQNGVDIKTLSGMLGHYSSGFTLDTYTHVTRKMQEEAAEKMGQFMEMKL